MCDAVCSRQRCHEQGDTRKRCISPKTNNNNDSARIGRMFRQEGRRGSAHARRRRLGRQGQARARKRREENLRWDDLTQKRSARPSPVRTPTRRWRPVGPKKASHADGLHVAASPSPRSCSDSRRPPPRSRRPRANEDCRSLLHRFRRCLCGGATARAAAAARGGPSRR